MQNPILKKVMLWWKNWSCFHCRFFVIVFEIKRGEEELVGQNIRDGELGWRGSEAWGLGRLESSTEWVNPWVSDVELRVGLTAMRQRGESLKV